MFKMRNPWSSLLSLQFRGFLLRHCLSTAPRSVNHLLSAYRFPLLPLASFSDGLNFCNFSGTEFQGFPARCFSSQTNDVSGCLVHENPEDISALAKLISNELLLKTSEGESLPLPKRLDLSFSHVSITPALLLTTLNISPDAGRVVLDFLKWAKSRPDFSATDEVFSYFVNYFGRRKDFKAAHEVLVDGSGVVGVKCFEAIVDRLVRAGRAAQVVALFEKMEKDYGFERNIDSLKHITLCLCKRGYASYAEKMVKSLANEYFPDSYICDALISGWCIGGKLDEARRLMDEMYRGGFEMSPSAYNALLDCVCRLCRQKDPFRLEAEAQNLLVEMERNGVPRNVETFNVLIRNLCKMRKTEDAMKLFSRMGE